MKAQRGFRWFQLIHWSEKGVTGSSLFSVELGLRQAELAGYEVEHGDEVGA
jgi:hypothetical protein